MQKKTYFLKTLPENLFINMELNMSSYPSTRTKYNIKGFRDPKVKDKAVKLIKENSKYLCNFGIGNYF
jgi:hypothetical protein